MDIAKVLEGLYARRATIDRAIAELQSMLDSPGYAVPEIRRRGRLGMGSAEREQVSKRMKKYWASRRELKQTASARLDSAGLVDRSESLQDMA
jgi:hypothetical protein